LGFSQGNISQSLKARQSVSMGLAGSVNPTAQSADAENTVFPISIVFPNHSIVFPNAALSSRTQ
jgi:hypothetical protein